MTSPNASDSARSPHIPFAFISSVPNYHISLFLHLTQSHQLVFLNDFSFSFLLLNFFIHLSHSILFSLVYRSLPSTVSFWFLLFLPFIMIKKAISPVCQPSYLSMYVSLLHSLSFLLQLSHSSFLSFIPLLLFLFFYKKPAFLLCSLSLFLFSFFPFYLCRFQYLSLAHSSLSFFTDQFHFKSLTLIQYLQASWD